MRCLFRNLFLGTNDPFRLNTNSLKTVEHVYGTSVHTTHRYYFEIVEYSRKPMKGKAEL